MPSPPRGLPNHNSLFVESAGTPQIQPAIPGFPSNNGLSIPATSHPHLHSMMASSQIQRQGTPGAGQPQFIQDNGSHRYADVQPPSQSSAYSTPSMRQKKRVRQMRSDDDASDAESFQGDIEEDEYYQDKGESPNDLYDEYDEAAGNQQSESESEIDYESEVGNEEFSRNPLPREDGRARPPRFTSATFSGLSKNFEAGARPRPKKQRKPMAPSPSMTSIAEDGGDLDVPLLESRYAGGSLHNTRGKRSNDRRDTNKAPELINEDDVTDEWLDKRGMRRSAPVGSGKKVPKRSCGANDPENIQIVNLREQEDMAFTEIVKIMNARRTKVGKDPRLTATGVANRYNRTAPLLFAAAGMKFVPLNQRKKGAQFADVVWTKNMNKALCRAVKKVEASKWEQVAEIFNAETGNRMDAATVSAKFVTF